MGDGLKFGAVIFAKDVDKLSCFYSGAFGLEVIFNDAEKSVLESEYVTLTIHGIPEKIAQTINISEPPNVREATPIKLCFSVKSIEESRVLILNTKGQLYPESKEWENNKFRACDGYDPEGNVFQVREQK